MATVTITNRDWDFYQGVNDNVYFNGSGNHISFGNGTSYNENMSKNKVLIYLSDMSGYSSITLNYTSCSMSGLTGLYFGLYWDPIGGDYFYTYDEIVEKSLSTGSGRVTLPIPSDVSDGYLGFAFHENSTNGNNCSNYASLTITSITANSVGYNLTYNANGGSGAPSSVSSVTSTTISNTIPTRFGYTFRGWNTSSSATSATYEPGDRITLNSNRTLYAVWQSPTVISSSVTSSSYSSFNYFGDGCEFFVFTPSTGGKYRFESDCSLDPQISIYNTSESLLAYNNDGGTNENFLLDYNFISGTKYYIKVSFYEEEIAEEVEEEIIEEEVIAVACEEIAEEVVEEIIEEEVFEIIEEEVIEEEVFEEVLEEEIIDFTVKRIYNITYDANGGSNAPSGQIKIYGETLTLSNSTPTKTNSTFLGWATSPSATSATYSKGGSFTTNEDTTLYAVWSVNYYYISYNANGGSGAPAYQKKTNGTDLTLSTTVPTRFGYTFLGWNTYSYATTAAYVPGGKFTNNAETTLYAVWESATEISSSEVSSSYSASIPFSGGYKFYSFTPAIGGKYRFESNEGRDPRIYLSDSDGNDLAFNDDGAGNLQFRLDYNLTSGVQYYIKVKHYSSYTGTINFTVKRQGLVYICDSTGEYSPYQALIYDGSNWNQCEPYIYNGSSWDLYSG